ncbi:MAG: PEP-CTERM sorting domain-containing protein [Gemmatimonadaceae bacterium]|nr:PEP-CTERM sorting domain-containing protein [Gemmatimonadaceae bacterium]
MQRTVRAAIGALIIMGAAPSVQAQTLTGTTVGGATFNRRTEAAGNTCGGASGLGTAVRYRTFSFFTPTAGAFTFALTAPGWDPFLFLYDGAFNPASPATNCIAADDDISGSNLNAQFTRTLVAGGTYIAVATGYANTDAGAFTLTVTGPTTLTVIPEPPEVALLATGMVGIGLFARRRRLV